MANEDIFRNAFQNLSNALNRGLSDFKQIESETDVFLKQWKKNYNAYLRARPSKRKPKNVMSETINENLSDLSEIIASNKSESMSTRPTRNARTIAIDNIRKHSMMPLGKKLRRPDSGDEVDCYSIASAKRIKSLTEHKLKTAPINDDVFAKPKEATRKKIIRKVEAKSQISEAESKENIVNIEIPVQKVEVEKSPGSEIISEVVALRQEGLNEPIQETVPVPEKMEEPEKTDIEEIQVEEKISPKITPRVTRSNQNLRKSSAGISYIAFSPVEPTAVNESVNSVTFSNEIEINGNKSQIVTSIRETINESIICDKSVEVRSSKRRKGNKSVNNESDIFESSNISLGVGGKKQKSRKKSKKNISSTFVDFLPNAESSSLHIDLDKTHNITPGNNTFLVKDIPVVNNLEVETGADIFAHVTETVVKGKRHVSNEVKRNSYEIADPVVEETVFQIPQIFHVPQPIASKRTKTVKASKYYDAEGNLLNEDTNTSKRTKVLAAATVLGVPDVTDISFEGRPVRVRTKVRRFGMSDEANPPPSEQPTTQVAKAVSRKSKARRASLKINQNLLTKLQASHKKLNTPLATVTNNLSAKKQTYIYLSASKENPLKLKKKTEHTRVIPRQLDDDINKVDNLKNKQQKEELASLKKLEEINRKKEILKQKNDEKLEKAKKIRQKQEEEKLEQIIQAEKEKELKRKMILLERERKQKEELNKKKLIADQKHANHEERRRLEEEARMEKIKEMELEQQRQLEEKQRRLEYEEKRAKERIEEKKRMLEAEKMQKQKMAEAKAELEKKQNAKNYNGLYLPKSVDDLGLEDERSEESGDDDDDDAATPAKNIPAWAKDKSENPIAMYITKEQMAIFMPLRSKTPDVHRMFNMSPARKLRRTSSAIWETTMMTPS